MYLHFVAFCVPCVNVKPFWPVFLDELPVVEFPSVVPRVWTCSRAVPRASAEFAWAYIETPSFKPQKPLFCDVLMIIVLQQNPKYLHIRRQPRASWGCNKALLWAYCAFLARQPTFPSPLWAQRIPTGPNTATSAEFPALWKEMNSAPPSRPPFYCRYCHGNIGAGASWDWNERTWEGGGRGGRWTGPEGPPPQMGQPKRAGGPLKR